MKINGITYRNFLFESDKRVLLTLVEQTGYFYPCEIDVVGELIQLYLDQGEESGYQFIIAEEDTIPLGFSCYGKNPCTKFVFDLYWLVVSKTEQNKGIGKALLAQTEKHVIQQGGRSLYVETSGRKLYENTRAFYEKSEYIHLVTFDDFYAQDDAKCVYRKLFIAD